jgi:hypothetical protein
VLLERAPVVCSAMVQLLVVVLTLHCSQQSVQRTVQVTVLLPSTCLIIKVGQLSVLVPVQD